ncbi:MAG: hypothetical protein J7L38_03345 [Thermoproteales archaeon]|nr:hypothetical protein [Thermoproteales archaeon]
MEAKKATLFLFTLIFITVASIIAWGLPIEDYLSTYPFFMRFKWYPAWRVALVNFFIWITLIILYTASMPELLYPILLSAVFFVFFHYLCIAISSTAGYSYGFLPFIYYVTWKNGMKTFYLDLGQVVGVVTVLLFLNYLWKDRRKKG